MRAVLVVSILLACVLAPGSAAKADDASHAEAKRLRDLGATALQAGDYQAALEHFRQAYRIYPLSKLKYNIGLAERKLGRFDMAFTTFEELVHGPRDDVTGFAEAQLVELQAMVGHLELRVSPAGAKISVDGDEVGTSPMVRILPLNPGAHRVLVEKSGRSVTRELTARAGDHLQIALELLLPLPPLPPQATPVTARREKLLRGFAWGTGALAVALAAGGVGAFYAHQGPFDSLNNSCNQTCAPDDPRIVSLESTVRTDEKVAYSLWGLAGAAAAVDVALWVISLRGRR